MKVKIICAFDKGKTVFCNRETTESYEIDAEQFIYGLTKEISFNEMKVFLWRYQRKLSLMNVELLLYKIYNSDSSIVRFFA